MTRFVSGGPVRGWNIGADTNRGVDVPDRPGGAPGPGRRRRLLRLLQQPVFYFGEDVATAGPLQARATARPSPKGAVVYDATDTITQVGVYVQDQMKLFDKLTLRARRARTTSRWHQQDDYLFNGGHHRPRRLRPSRTGRGSSTSSSRAWPSYASYATSFQPVTFGARADGTGVRARDRASRWRAASRSTCSAAVVTSTVAVYHLTRQNVTVDDPNNEGFSIQTGEQRSQGRRGERAGAYRRRLGRDSPSTPTPTPRSPRTPRSRSATGCPTRRRHSAGLWTTWTFPSGPLKGLGAGFGFRYVGERPGGPERTPSRWPDYVVLDASVFYRRGRPSRSI